MNDKIRELLKELLTSENIDTTKATYVLKSLMTDMGKTEMIHKINEKQTWDNFAELTIVSLQQIFKAHTKAMSHSELRDFLENNDAFMNTVQRMVGRQ